MCTMSVEDFIMSHINIENSKMGRVICIDVSLLNKYEEFFMGWSGASEPITPEETYALVDKLKVKFGLSREIGELYGRVKSYQGLVYLNSEIPLPGTMFKVLCGQYV